MHRKYRVGWPSTRSSTVHHYNSHFTTSTTTTTKFFWCFLHVHTARQNHNQLSMLVRRGLSTRVWKSPLEVQRSTLTRCTAYPRFWIVMCWCTDCRPEMTPMDLVRVWQFTTTDPTSYLTMTWLWLYHDMTIRWPWHEHDMSIPWQWSDSDMSMIWSWLDLT